MYVSLWARCVALLPLPLPLQSWPECQFVTAAPPPPPPRGCLWAPGCAYLSNKQLPHHSRTRRPHLSAWHVLPCLFSLVCLTRAMILSCVDGAPPFMPNESITPACSTALLSAGSLFHFNQCWSSRKCFSSYLLGKEQLCQALWLSDVWQWSDKSLLSQSPAMTLLFCLFGSHII